MPPDLDLILNIRIYIDSLYPVILQYASAEWTSVGIIRDPDSAFLTFSHKKLRSW